MCVHVKESSEGFWLLGPDALIIIPHLEPPFGRIFPKLIPKSQEDLEMFAYNLQITTKVQIFFSGISQWLKSIKVGDISYDFHPSVLL